MELKEIVIHNPCNLPKAKPCCIVCFQPQTETNLFVLDDLDCRCNPNLHEGCVQTWFQIARQEVCPKCGEKWAILQACPRFEEFFRNCLVCSFILILFIFGGIGLYQVIANFYLNS
jgi:hypothetical protein